MATPPRPLSPHLQVYRPQYTSVLSVLHRATGLVLALGLVLLAAALVALAEGPAAWARVAMLLGSGLGRLVAGGVAFAFWYHFCAGLRHLVFDSGRGLERSSARRSAAIVVVAALVLGAATVLAMLRAGAQP